MAKNKNEELEMGGFSFGITSGVITTLGMIVGISSATSGSKLAIVAAIITVAFADAFSDAFGMHLAEESRLSDKNKPIWLVSLYTFFGKVLFSTIFLIPMLLLATDVAIVISVGLGLVIIASQAAYTAARRKSSVARNIIEHTCLMILVLIVSNYLGQLADSVSKING